MIPGVLVVCMCVCACLSVNEPGLLSTKSTTSTIYLKKTKKKDKHLLNKYLIFIDATFLFSSVPQVIFYLFIFSFSFYPHLHLQSCSAGDTSWPVILDHCLLSLPIYKNLFSYAREYIKRKKN